MGTVSTTQHTAWCSSHCLAA